MFHIFFFFLLVFSRLASGGYIETVAASGCESCPIYITCRRFTSIIAILEALFVPNGQMLLNLTQYHNVPYPRQCLNRRCSGINHCSFIMTEDCPGAEYWGEGVLYIKYVCIPEDRLVKYCNKHIILPNNNDQGISEGYIRNPGYPRFYGGQSACIWKIKAPNGQRIRLTIFDVSLLVDNPVAPNECTKDHLDILDSEIIVHTTCRAKEPPDELLSLSDSLEIVLSASERLTPLRGILLHYTAVGCSTPIPPADSYLVFLNDTLAVFSCCVGYVFPDTGTRSREMLCEGSKWSERLPLPNCEKLGSPGGVESIPNYGVMMASDIIAPALFIGALFAINSVVLFYIYKAKRKNEIKLKDEEIGALNSQEMTSVVS